MPWNSTWPLGSVSVKTNRPTGQENTTYIETTENVDHFFNIAANKDGHHNVIQQPAQFNAGVPVNPAKPVAPMSGKLYVRTVSDAAGNDNSRQLFFRQDFYDNAYQISPVYRSGVVALNGATFSTVTSIPQNVYGTIWIWKVGTTNIQTGTFISDNTVVNVFSTRIKIQGLSADSDRWVEFGNGSNASGLNIQALRDQQSGNGNFNWKLFFYGVTDLP